MDGLEDEDDAGAMVRDDNPPLPLAATLEEDIMLSWVVNPASASAKAC